MPDVSWEQVVMYLLVATSAGTRLVAWVRASRARMMVCQVLANVLEYMAEAHHEGAPRVKEQAKEALKTAHPLVQREAVRFAAEAERAVGTKGGTSSQEIAKRKRLVPELLRWLPVVGAFAP